MEDIPNEKREKSIKKTFLILAIVIAMLVVGCFVYVQDYYRADKASIRAFCQANADVTVDTWKDDTMVFAPEEPVAGLIFYPGGKVEDTAYVPLMWELAQQGVLCVLVEMPCNLALLESI